MTPGAGRGITPGTRTPQGYGRSQGSPQEDGHLYTWTLGEGARDRDTDTSMGHVTRVTAGYIYQLWMENGISPEPELYKCNTVPILVNIAKIALTSWISI